MSWSWVIFLCSLSAACVLLRYHSDGVRRLARKFEGNNGTRVPFLLISMDSFRHDYIEVAKRGGASLPNFDRLLRQGARATHVENVFPTVTLPNHQSIMTGLYAESHGIVLNEFPDSRWPAKNEWYNMNNQTILNWPRYFTGKPDPAWVSMERAGVKTSSMLWPNTDASFNGQLPFVQVGQYYILTKYRFPFDKRVNMTVDWLANSAKYGIQFASLYFEEPDDTGHAYGPYSKEVRDKIILMDRLLGSLLDQLKARGSLDEMNIVLTADHGMAEVFAASEDCPTCIYLDDYIPASYYNLTMEVCGAPIFPNPNQEKFIYNLLKNSHPKLKVWRRTDPEAKKMHYQNNVNIPPIYAQPEWPYTVYQSRSTTKGRKIYGTHGYPPSFSDMWPVWIGRGPAFKKNFSMSSRMESVDLYPLMMSLMGLEPNPNNGSMERLIPLLKPKMWSQLNDSYTGYCLFPKAADCGFNIVMGGVADFALLCMLLALCVAIYWFVKDLRVRAPRSSGDACENRLEQPPPYNF